MSACNTLLRFTFEDEASDSLNKQYADVIWPAHIDQPKRGDVVTLSVLGDKPLKVLYLYFQVDGGEPTPPKPTVDWEGKPAVCRIGVVVGLLSDHP